MGGLADFFGFFKGGDPNKSAVANEIERSNHRKMLEAKRQQKKAEKKRRLEIRRKMSGMDDETTQEWQKSSKDGPTYNPLDLAEDPTYSEFSGLISKLGTKVGHNRNRPRTQQGGSNQLMNKIKF